MKLLHLADLHLGKSLADFELIDDQRYILNQVIDIVKEKEIDTVLLAGDVYDRSIPSEAATNLLDYFLSELFKLKINICMISGNHDSDERLNFGSELFKANKLYISAKFDGRLKCQTLEDESGEINIYLLPFVKASQVRHYFPDEDINTYEDAVKVIIKDAEIDRTKRNILVAHQFVAGKNTDPVLGGSEGTSVQTVGLVEKIGYDCFDDFDYVALGHIHSAQSVGREEIRYSGSLLKYSLSEVNSEKSVPIITVGKKGEVNIELEPLKPLRDLRHLKGTLKQLLDKNNIKGSKDFIYVTLLEEEIIDDVMSIFQQEYENTVKIVYENSHTKAMGQFDINEITEEKPFDVLIGDFYRMMYGCEISEEEMKIMKEAAKEAGIIYEAD